MAKVLLEQLDDLRFLGGIYQEMENGFRDADYEAELQASLEVLREETAKNYGARVDPHGSPWPPLKPSTIAKKGHDTPLVETGAMKASTLEKPNTSHVEEVFERSAIFGTEDEKALFHQEGTQRIPQRAFLGATETTIDSIVSRAADRAVESLKYTL